MKNVNKRCSGNTIVEAALIFPLIIMIIGGIIITALSVYEHIKTDSEIHKSDARHIHTTSEEDLLRGKWIISRENNNEQSPVIQK